MLNGKTVWEVAIELLKGEGLSRTSFARVILNKENIIPKDKDTTRKSFDDAIKVAEEKYSDEIYKDGHIYRLKEVDVEALKESNAKFKAEVAELKAKIAELTGKVQGGVPERKQWLYKKGEGTMFPISEVEEKLADGWKDHPKGS